MQPPSSQYLTHKYPVWAGCTLGEIGLIGGATLVISALLCLSAGLFFGQIAKCMLLMIPLIFIAPKAVLKRVAKLKAAKPQGSVMIAMRIYFEKSFGFKTPYVRRIGVWSTQRSLKVRRET